MISAERFQKIRAVISDIDGVLTDGTVGYGTSDFIKFFNYRDGHWMKMAKRQGYIVGLISGRSSEANRMRAKELGLDFCKEDRGNKLLAFEEVLAEFNLKPEECLYVGDDVIDAPVMRRAGIGVAVADAVPFLDEVADWRLNTPGGHGAFVEIFERLFKESGVYDEVLERYRK